MSQDPEGSEPAEIEAGEQRVFFDGDHGLEGRLGWPGATFQGGDCLPTREIRGGVVVAHPYPPHGGNMDLPVVHHIAKQCRARQLATLRFNFRSVGRSSGDFSGTEEHRDVMAAVKYLTEQAAPDGRFPWHQMPLGLAGWSFGSVMVARAVADLPEVEALALVGFVPRWEHTPEDTLERLSTFGGPVLAVCAEHDDMGSPENVAEVLDDLSLDYRVEVVRDADHYLAEKHREVGKMVADFFSHAVGRA